MVQRTPPALDDDCPWNTRHSPPPVSRNRNVKWIVRPAAPKGTPGVYDNFDSFSEAYEAVSMYSIKKHGLYLSKELQKYEAIHGPIDVNKKNYKRLTRKT